MLGSLLLSLDADLPLQIWIFVELVFVYFFYVETRGPTLEELAKIFDGEDAEVAHVDMEHVLKDETLREDGAVVGGAEGEKYGLRNRTVPV